jgi:hypothetical protein
LPNDIAVILEVPGGAVKSRIARGVEQAEEDFFIGPFLEFGFPPRDDPSR